MIRIKQAYGCRRQVLSLKLSENGLFWLEGRVKKKKAIPDSTRIVETLFRFIRVNRNKSFVKNLLLQSISYNATFKMNSCFKF